MKRNWLSVMVIIAVTLSVWGGLPAQRASSSLATEIVIERFVFDGQVASTEGDEYVKICNISGSSINLGGTNPWRMGDDINSAGGTEGMYNLQGTLAVGGCFIIASNANGYNSIRGSLPDYEMNPTQAGWTDNASVPNLVKVGTGTWGASNTSDNITLWKYVGSAYVKHDEIAYGGTSTRYSEVGLSATGTYQVNCGTNINCAVVRNSRTIDTDNMANDFNNTSAPNAVTLSDLSATTPVSPAPIVFGALGLIAAAMLLRRKAAHTTSN